MLFHPKGYKDRLILLEDVEGETVTIGFGSSATEFDEHASEAQNMIDSVERKSAWERLGPMH